MAFVLLVEDDPAIRISLTRALGAKGHTIASVPHGGGALSTVLRKQPDLVVLDLGLPDMDGRDVLTMLRGVSDVPVIVATARDDEQEIIRLLDAGADDYVVKPFGASQLDARIRAVLRRTSEAGPPAPLVVGELSIDARTREARLAGRLLDLKPKEFDLLLFLAENQGTVVSKRDLLIEVWHQPYGGADKTVDVHLSWLRRKLGETAAEPRYLHTVRGVGVKLAPPEEAAPPPEQPARVPP
ncbi:MAG TPA: response regulator transcription factor [Actinopolymorphaceae bacterium]